MLNTTGSVEMSLVDLEQMKMKIIERLSLLDKQIVKLNQVTEDDDASVSELKLLTLLQKLERMNLMLVSKKIGLMKNEQSTPVLTTFTVKNPELSDELLELKKYLQMRNKLVMKVKKLLLLAVVERTKLKVL